jgi:hypothetical protein
MSSSAGMAAVLQSVSRRSGSRFAVRKRDKTERFQAKWEPVRRPETRQDKDLSRLS